MYLDRLKLDYEKAKEMNDKITILRKRLQHVNLLLDDVENYVKNLNFLLRVVNIEETNFKKRRLGYLNQSITEALAEIFPNEQFIAKIDCDVVRGKNYAQLILYDWSHLLCIISRCCSKSFVNKHCITTQSCCYSFDCSKAY